MRSPEEIPIAVQPKSLIKKSNDNYFNLLNFKINSLVLIYLQVRLCITYFQYLKHFRFQILNSCSTTQKPHQLNLS